MSSFKFEAWPTEYRVITQYFGANPAAYAQFGLPGHDGVDIRAPEGSKVFAVAPGRVESVVRKAGESNYGIHIRVAHADGYETLYGHLLQTLVKEGNRVEAGTLLGLAGNTGNSNAPHLHLGLKRKGTTLNGWPGNIMDPTRFLLPLLAWKRPAGPFVDGWVCSAALTVIEDLAQVNTGDAHLRVGPAMDDEVIDLIPSGTMLIVSGAEEDGSLPVQVPSRALDSAPALAPPPEPDPNNLTPPPGVVLGWAWTDYLHITGHIVMVGRHGVVLRGAPSIDAEQIGEVQWGFLARLVGLAVNGYSPLFIYASDVAGLRDPKKVVQKPRPFPETSDEPPENVVQGWVLTVQIHTDGTTAVVGREGTNLREAPRRNAPILGYLPVGTKLQVTSSATGEYTPVQVNEQELEKPPAEQPSPQPDPDPQPLGQVRIGLHASADPGISEAEIVEFGLFRPGIIKVLSFHDPDGLRKLALNHPDAHWIVRAFLDFGGRSISPQQFFNDTINDMRRTLEILDGRDVVIELHNEPNVYAEGLGSAWNDGRDFAIWWLRLLRLYRYIFPNHHFLYPGLSPGASIAGFRQEHVRFFEASRAAVDAADGLGVHLYWSSYYPMERALGVLDDYVSREGDKPVWVTEASNNTGATGPAEKATQYLAFWKELQKRPLVQGVTYFVASALDPRFQDEVFLGRGMSRIIGAR